MMWSILADALPEFISIGEALWPVRTDFRVWLRAGRVLSEFSPDDNEERQKELIEALYCEVIPENEPRQGVILWDRFIEAVSVFYVGPHAGGGNEEGKPAAKRQFDFLYDSGFIYQSFASFYQIRLCSVEMHWWEFLTLFDGLMLNENNSMNFVVGVRQRKISDIPKQQRAAYGKMKKSFALPKGEKQAEMENAVFDRLEQMWAQK